MLTARALCLAVAMLLLASCGNEPNRILPNISIPPVMRAVIIIVKQDISAAPGDHVDLLAMDKGVEVMQVETRNPHFHEEKGDDHLKEMFNGSLGCVYHSKICPPRLREKIIEELHTRGILEEGQELEKLKKINPFKDIDMHEFAKILHDRATSFIRSV